MWSSRGSMNSKAKLSLYTETGQRSHQLHTELCEMSACSINSHITALLVIIILNSQGSIWDF